jgi:MFS family permease
MTWASRHRASLFACGVLLGLIAEQMVLFAAPLLIYGERNDVALLGVAFAVEWLPALLAYPFAGLIADRVGGRRLFLSANTVRAVALGAVAVICLIEPALTTIVLILNGALMSLMVAPVRMAVEKVVPEIASGDELPKTQALVQNMELVAMALGPACAVVAAALFGKIWLLGLAAGLLVGALFCWRLLPLVPVSFRLTDDRTLRGTLTELRLGWSLLFGIRPVVLLAALNFSINLVFATTLSANAAVVTGVLHAPEWSFGLLNACAGLVGLVNLLATSRLLKVFSVYGIGLLGFSLLNLGLFVVGIAPSFVLYAPAFIGALAGVAYFNVFNRTQRIKVIPREHLGKVMGPFYLLNLLSYPLGGLLIATLGASLGPQLIITVMAVGLSLVGATLLPLVIRSFRLALAAPGGQVVPL